MIAQMVEVTRSYGPNVAVKSLSFEVSEGQMVGLIGPSGSGKTTTLKLLAGILHPTRGKVWVLGGPTKRNRARISYLPETGFLYPWMGPRQARRFMTGLFPDFQPNVFQELLDVIGVPNRPAHSLSQGERERLEVALVVARRASLYLLDEPLGGIDIFSRERILKALVREWRADAAVILSTHEITEAEGLFDRVLFLRDGELVLDAQAEDLRAQGKSILEAFREVCA